jgi:hypothetical protein
MPELVEPISRINYTLEKDFGRYTDGRPIWRVVWSGDQYEQRWVQHTSEGFELLFPEVQERRKYQHIIERYVLEMLRESGPKTDLTTPMSYEPVWVFRDRFENYLPPTIWACKLVIDTVMENMHKGVSHKKYFDPNTSEEQRQATILKMEQELFGNETPVGDALRHKFGVTDFHQKVKLDSAENSGEARKE